MSAATRKAISTSALRGADRKENGGTPEDARRGIDMLNVLEMPSVAQPHLSFIKDGLAMLSAVQANQVLVHSAYDGQRKISRGHVDVLADIMRSGGWMQKSPIVFARFAGRLYLINGYHRMHAQVQSGKPLLWYVVITDCESMDEVKSLYYKFDTNIKVRGAEQVLNGVGFSEETGLSKTMGRALYNAVPVIAAGFSKEIKDRDILTARNIDRRLAVAREYVEAAQNYEKCIGRVRPVLGRKMRLAGVTAVALVTLRYQPDKAAPFWKGVAGEAGGTHDPRRTLREDLLGRPMNVGSQVQSVSAPAYAWNAWFEGRTLKQIKVYASRKAHILGTPFEE